MSPPDSVRTSAPPRRGLRLTGIVFAIAAIIIVATGLYSRASGNARLREWTDAQAIPIVAVAPPAPGANAGALELPGRLEAYSRAPIYARVSVYLKSWRYDIGAHVKAGQVLAEIETPDLDQQLQQARADLNTAQANEKLAEVTADRWQKILKSNAVSKQDVDEKVSDLAAKRAAVASAKANVDRFVAMRFHAYRRAVRRCRDCAQHRCRRADQRRHRGGPGALRHFRYAQAACVRQCAAGVRAQYSAGHEGRADRARTSRKVLCGDDRNLVAGGNGVIRYDADATRRRQFGR
jgi:multidrug efflux pump subunit AcrA (membrane-fusion protein)